jgi:DHA2 family multidrug resistance protein
MNNIDNERPGGPNKWLVAFTVLFGTFMPVMDVTVVNVSLPHMMGSFGQGLQAITWVVTGYAISQIIMATMAGWWSALLGRKRL